MFLTYAAKRILMMIPTLLGVAIIIFLMVRVLPGDIVDIKYGSSTGSMVPQSVIDAERARLGLDRPMPAQMVDWLTGLVRLDLGTSLWTERPVWDEIALRFPVTIQTAVLSIVIAVLVAVPMGTIAAIYHGTIIDQVVRLLTIGGIAIPSFWLGLLILMGLLTMFSWAPPLYFVSFHRDPVQNLALLFWPAVSVGYRLASLIARMIRSSLLEVMNEDYIRTARARGLREREVLMVHAMRPAMISIVTVVGLVFAHLLGGQVITENVFSWNGIGRLAIQAMLQRDYPLVQGFIVIFATSIVLVTTALDLLYGLLDPRVRRR